LSYEKKKKRRRRRRRRRRKRKRICAAQMRFPGPMLGAIL
jgi:hypothetical protein